MTALEADVRAALAGVEEPELRRSVTELGMVESVDTKGGKVRVALALPLPGDDTRAGLRRRVIDSLVVVEGVDRVDVEFRDMDDAELQTVAQILKGVTPNPLRVLDASAAAAPRAPEPRPNPFTDTRTRILAVASGKGGVGKSSVTANLAAALAADGKQVGVLDADVWGYSQPRMLGLGAERPRVNAQRKLIPLSAHDGISVMSIGFFIEQDAAVVWRGPMLHKALQQFLEDVDWGELDYLLIDLPPGTGDVSMTLAQLLPQAKFLIVTTPQPVAQKVARRSAEMAAKLKLEIAGVIENMSGFVTPTGERYQLFGEGGGHLLAEELDVPLLAKVPLTMALREQSDAGIPVVLADPEDPAAQALRHGARGLIALSPIELPVMQAPAPAAAPKPVGMSLPMA
jgi:ATP-binding protein involved in chromosome partitioning